MWLVGVCEIAVAGRVAETDVVVGWLKLMWLVGVAEIDRAGRVAETDVVVGLSLIHI